jgi:NAD(P)-dependent dehydrogenase (short-subunit alcohol dehydrogenase family)
MIHDADNPGMHVMTTTLDGRTALVTGAGRGIGRAIAIGLGRRGVRVGLLARTQRDLDEVAAKIRDDGGTAVPLAADIGDADQTRSALERLAGFAGDAGTPQALAARPCGRYERDQLLAVAIPLLVHCG